MKILLFCLSNIYSGAEIYSMELAMAFHARGFKVVVVCLPNAIVSKKFSLMGFEVLERDFGAKLSRSTALKFVLNFKRNILLMNELIAENLETDLVIFQFKGEQLLFSLATDDKSTFKTISIEHGPIPTIFHFPPLRMMLANFYGKMTKVFAVSAGVSDSLKKFKVCAQTLPPGVNQKLVDLRDEIPSEASILFAGRLSKKKGVKTFIDIATMNPNTTFYVAGSGKLSSWVEEKSKTQDNLFFLGSVDDISVPLSITKSVAILSRERGEGRPLIALEAIQAGRHVFISENCKIALLLKSEFQECVTILKKNEFDQITSKLEQSTLKIIAPYFRTLPSWELVSKIVIPDEP